jgi:hypothetical protein
MGLDRWVWPIACPRSLARGVHKCVRHKLRNRGTHARNSSRRRVTTDNYRGSGGLAPLGAGPFQFWCTSVSSAVSSLHLETRLASVVSTTTIHRRRASGGHRQRRIAMDEMSLFGCSSFSSAKCCRRSKLTNFLAGVATTVAFSSWLKVKFRKSWLWL